MTHGKIPTWRTLQPFPRWGGGGLLLLLFGEPGLPRQVLGESWGVMHLIYALGAAVKTQGTPAPSSTCLPSLKGSWDWKLPQTRVLGVLGVVGTKGSLEGVPLLHLHMVLLEPDFVPVGLGPASPGSASSSPSPHFPCGTTTPPHGLLQPEWLRGSGSSWTVLGV